jgi:hypothetical protein
VLCRHFGYSEASGAVIASRVAGRDPSLNLWSEPQSRPTRTEIDRGPGHVHVALLIRTDAISMREPEEIGDALGVDEVLSSHPWRHDRRLRLLTFGCPPRRLHL